MDLGRNSVSILFERSSEWAEVTEFVQKAVAKKFDPYTPPEDVVKRSGNVVIVWKEVPTDDEEARVDDCLT